MTLERKPWKILLLILVLLTIFTTGCTPDGGQNSSIASADISGGESDNSALGNSSVGSLDDYELENRISEEIISENKSKFRPGEAQIFAAEHHKILKIVEQKDSVTVYLIALYAQYQGSEGRIDLTGAVCSPVSIVFSKDEHQYVLDEYWVPEDGEGYEQSLREKFPSDIIECALELELPDGMETCDQKAKDYFGVPQDEAPYVSTLASALETAEKQFSYTPSDRSESIEDIALHLGADFFEYLKEPHSYTYQVEDYRNLELADSGVWWEERFGCWRCDFKVELLYSGEYGLIGPCDGWCTDDDIAIGGVGIFLEEDGSYTMISLAHIP